ncbi:unnamed protein product, partial [Scytosiphon promiscuus]
ALTLVQERPELSIPSPDEGGVSLPDGCQSWELQHELPPGTLPSDPERSRMPRSMCMVDTTSQVESTAPELLPLWVRHGHQVPEELARDLNLGGTLARVKLCEALDHASLEEPCRKAMSGLPETAATALRDLLCLQLKLSYLSTKTPEALREYTHSRDAGGLTRREEAALLARLSADHSFPRSSGGSRDNVAAAAAAVLPLLAGQLGLAKEDVAWWGAAEEVFGRAYAWAVRTECLLVEGCDDRITVPYGTGKVTNKYHCSPVPTPDVVSRSSCTSSSSSRRAFGSADDARHDMLLSWALKEGVGRDQGGREDSALGLCVDGCFTNRMSDIRWRLLDVMGMDRKKVEVFLTPSGSDAELLPTALACVRARRLGHEASDGPAVTSIVVAAGEVGSGTAGAAGGKHFSKLTPRGVPGHPDQHVKGMSTDDVVVVQLKTRSKSGAFLPCEDLVRSAVNKALSTCPTSVAVVHFVAGSKTGICSPSESVLTEMQQRYGERLLVVVDACQLRSEPESVQRYLSLGFPTLVTGSKFFCGPPFCGAVMLPPAALAELEAGREGLPTGFDDYFTRHEVDSRFSKLRSRLPEWENRGLLLRWSGALANMEAVKSIPRKRLNAFVGSWVERVRDNVQDKWPYLSLLPEQRTMTPTTPPTSTTVVNGVSTSHGTATAAAPGAAHAHAHAVGGVNTVVPIVVRVPRTSSEGPDGNPEVALGYDDLRLFHRLLSEDIGRLLPQDLDVGDRASARLRVLLGQPVKLGGASFGVIRMALGADMLIDAFCPHSRAPNREQGRPFLAAAEHAVSAEGENGGVARLLAQDRLVVNKCALMARHWHLLKEAATGVPAAGTFPPVHRDLLKALAKTIQDMGKDELFLLGNLVAARQRELAA